MLWAVIVVAIIVVLLLVRAGSKRTDQDTVTSTRTPAGAGATPQAAPTPSPSPSSRTPASRPTDRPGPAPARAYTTPRPASAGATPARDRMPFASPGMKGTLFTYGGPACRGSREHTGSYAVIDLETTGLAPTRGDRIIEIAVARVDADGRIEDEYATLINPEGRDTGPVFIHGISNDAVAKAPTFAEVAPELLARLDGAVVVAHNAPFEERFLGTELTRAGHTGMRMPALCTLWLGQQTFRTPNHKLGTLARAAGIPLVDKHAALGDVRAVAGLLPRMFDTYGQPVHYTSATFTGPRGTALGTVRPVTRAVELRKGTDGWMHSLMARLPMSASDVDDAAAEVYLDALAEALADGKIIGEEAKYLAKLAGSAGMGGRAGRRAERTVPGVDAAGRPRRRRADRRRVQAAHDCRESAQRAGVLRRPGPHLDGGRPPGRAGPRVPAPAGPGGHGRRLDQRPARHRPRRRHRHG
jgi:DNA polymerase-3 subunit epsilon